MKYAWKTLLIIGPAVFLMGCDNRLVGVRDDGGVITGFYINEPAEACSDGDEVCKEVDCAGAILVTDNEITCEVTITVDNDSGDDWANVRIKDRFGSEWALSGFDDDCDASDFGANPSGRQERLETNSGGLNDGDTWVCTFDATTKLNPGGAQEFTSCGYHDFNSGVTVKAEVPKSNGKGNRQISFGTGDGGTIVMCIIEDSGQDDCDLDGLDDITELNAETDPCDPTDPEV